MRTVGLTLKDTKAKPEKKEQAPKEEPKQEKKG